MKTVRIGVVGAGFAAEFHLRALRRIPSAHAEVVGVAAGTPESARAFAARHGIPRAHDHLDSLLASDVDLVLVAVPSALHEEVTITAAAAGKHVLVEKPLTGAFDDGAGPDPGSQPDSRDPVTRAQQELAAVRASTARIAQAVGQNGVRLAYAENWVHTPAVARLRDLIRCSGAPLLDLRGEQSHSGSHSLAARRRATAGGGALLTLGAHPLATVLHLKSVESALHGGRAIRPVSVMAETASLHELVAARGARTELVRDWEDVETWASLVLGFDDGSRATVTASFQMLGGVRDLIEVYTADAAYRAKLTQHDEVGVFTPDAQAFPGQTLQEKSESPTGWHAVPADPSWSHGHIAQLEDAIGAVREDRAPLAGIDLARNTAEIVYAAYLSAARGARVALGRDAAGPSSPERPHTAVPSTPVPTAPATTIPAIATAQEAARS